ncbi:hypothetical protein [Ruegeria arenilitoris]|uniref:hypothetical protein n=1 Tax=Ruegeria arenilitoris TaxID=1173585 RepID=UPI00147F6EAA|nr:hypothetical protein [Ruegeria arenilitoris]
MTVLRWSVALICLATASAAQDLIRNVEMPAHRALMEARANTQPNEFETDGCSGGLSSSWRLLADTFPKFGVLYEEHPPWENCCVTHDRAYHNAGGSQNAEESFDARLQADDALRSCVKSHGESHAEEYASRYEMSEDQIRSAHSITAEAMFMAVRFGGGPCSGLPWRWGFGYPGCSVFKSR